MTVEATGRAELVIIEVNESTIIEVNEAPGDPQPARSKMDDDDEQSPGGPTIMAPFNFNGRADWDANFTNLMLDLHYQPFGPNGNDTRLGAADYYNSTFADASSFTRLKGGSNLLRVDIGAYTTTTLIYLFIVGTHRSNYNLY